MYLFFVVALVVCCHTANAAPAMNVEMPKNWQQFEKMHGNSMEKLFAQYKLSFDKKFESKHAEESHFQVFTDRVRSILDWNKDTTKSYTKGINRFTDLTADERRKFVMPETKMEVINTLVFVSQFNGV